MMSDIKYNKYVMKVLATDMYKDFPVAYKKNGEPYVVAVNAVERDKRIAWIDALKKKQNASHMNHADFLRKNIDVKITVCKKCGQEHSIYYEYPNANLLKRIKTLKENISIIDQYDEHHSAINSVFKISSKSELTSMTRSRSSMLSPGAMSNFPDRLTGFHDFNLCCRRTADKGRHKENMNKYNKDRRSFEFLSDGNIRAANQFMKHEIFKGISADHIGPISLGFVHDPANIAPLSRPENSSKNNRITKSDINQLIEISKTHKVVSDYAEHIWQDYLKKPYPLGKLRVNMLNNTFRYMNLMSLLKELNLKEFTEVIKKKLWSFDYDFIIDSNGVVLNKVKRRKTASSIKEVERAIRIFSDANTYSNNRRKRPGKLTTQEKERLSKAPTYDELLKILRD